MRTFHCKPVHAAAAFLLALGLTGAAQAGLGDRVDSVQSDRAAVRAASLSVTQMPSYDLHTMTTAEGVLVHEYVSHSGTVFAVTWKGGSQPDLAVVLGKHYADYLKAATAPHHNHKLVTIQSAGLSLSIQKIGRGFVGTAHVPALLPAGVTRQDIR